MISTESLAMTNYIGLETWFECMWIGNEILNGGQTVHNMYAGRYFYLETSKYLMKYAQHEKNVGNKSFPFSRGKNNLKKFTPRTHGGGGGDFAN